MKTELYSENPTKSFIRQADLYEAADLDGQVSIQNPFTSEDTRKSIEEKGANWAGLMRQANQVFRENIGNLWANKVKTAATKKEELPGQAELDALIANYDFSGARSTSEAGLSDEERVLRSVLRTQLKALLRNGSFSADEESALTVQTQKEASKDELPEGKIAVKEFEALLEATVEGAVFEFEDRLYDFSGDPEFTFDDAGNIDSYANWAAIPAHCKEMAAAQIELDKRTRNVTARIPG